MVIWSHKSNERVTQVIFDSFDLVTVHNKTECDETITSILASIRISNHLGKLQHSHNSNTGNITTFNLWPLYTEKGIRITQLNAGKRITAFNELGTLLNMNLTDVILIQEPNC